jgi:glycerophosphoryl diester phosphodiesterase
MNIIAHRGFWKAAKEQNSLSAIQRAVENGFGVETDVRDVNGRLVIAHDPGAKKSVEAHKVFSWFRGNGDSQMLAINVKSNGLQGLIQKEVRRASVGSYFTFDASLPDTLWYIKNRIPVFTRQSEYEVPLLLSKAKGVWLDAFNSDWFSSKVILSHLRSGKKVCIVSPELQGRSVARVWRMLKAPAFDRYQNKLFLCTDLPAKADKFFN